MGLFPQSFLEELRSQADIVRIVQDHVSLKRSGATYKGLCPFHGEKTPSFHVNGDRGFFHCFGCGVGGDVFKFVQLQQRLDFPEAVRYLAQRVGLPVPELETSRDPAADEEREALLKAHELAGAYFRDHLAGSAGREARALIRRRKLAAATVEQLAMGFAPPGRDGLATRLRQQGFATPLLVRSGLVAERDGRLVDRFRNRLMFPICRDGGSIVAFAGRAMMSDQQPKYINSPETVIYSKGRILYGLNLSKAAIRRLGYAVLVEGYFDFAQAVQAGITPAVASCGTALTPAQARLLKRWSEKVVLSFDPDAAGQLAASRSCELLVAEGFQVKVAVLPAGDDPDTFIQKHGGDAYAQLLRASQPYLDYLLDRTAEGYDFAEDGSRREFLTRMLGVAARIPDAAARDQFADRLAHRARILEEVVRAEIRKAAMARRTTLTERELPGVGEVRPAESGLIWALAREPVAAVEALAETEEADLEGLVTGPILRLARSLQHVPAEIFPSSLFERLSSEEADLVRRLSGQVTSPAPPVECAKALRRLRYERERAAVQREIDRLQNLGAAQHDRQIEALWARKLDLLHRIEALST